MSAPPNARKAKPILIPSFLTSMLGLGLCAIILEEPIVNALRMEIDEEKVISMPAPATETIPVNDQRLVSEISINHHSIWAFKIFLILNLK
jgi:hypothetical protein